MSANPCTFMLLLCATNLITVGQTRQQPNIVVFMVDDLGWQDTSEPFWTAATLLNKRYHTPNMERLASEGLKFTNAYATSVCTPSRVSILTGMNAAHHGVTNWTHPLANTNTDNEDLQFASAKWNYNGLSPVPDIPHTVYATPLPQLLKAAGYFTVHVGKAHWGSAGTPGANPYNLGFMVNIAGHAAGHPQSYLGQERYGNIPGKAGLQAVPDLSEYFGRDTFLTEALTLEAIKTLEQPIKDHRPFFLHRSHYAVHTPLYADKRFYQKYLDAGLDTAEAKYASLIEGVDKSLGDLINYLKAKRCDGNTVFIFMSDNGGLSLSPPRGGKPHTHNLPLKAGKGSLHEGGIRVPMLVRWPGVAPAGASVDQPVIVEDFFPSILEMAGISPKGVVQQVDGESFVPLITQQLPQTEERILIWHAPNKWLPQDGPAINYKSAIRKGDWKLIYDMRDGSMALYNLKDDIGEQRNVADSYPEKKEELASLLGSQLRRWRAPMPVVRANGSIAPFPDKIR